MTTQSYNQATQRQLSFLQRIDSMLGECEVNIIVCEVPVKHLVGTIWLNNFCIATCMNKPSKPENFDIDKGSEILKDNLKNRASAFLRQHVGCIESGALDQY